MIRNYLKDDEDNNYGECKKQLVSVSDKGSDEWSVVKKLTRDNESDYASEGNQFILLDRI